MLSDLDINTIADKLELPIIGVYSKDKLPKDRDVGSYYINMENSDDGEGTHWVLAKIYKDDDGYEGAIYFDSFGVDMPKEVEDFLNEYKPIPFNNKQIQSVASTQCGWYCLYCDYYLTHHSVKDDLIDDYANFIKIWNNDTSKNLTLLKELFKPL